MKIVFATGIYPPDIGGPATYVERLAGDLAQRGFEVRIITYANLNPIKDHTANKNSKLFAVYGKQFKIKRISRALPGGVRYFMYCWHLLLLARDTDIIYVQNVTSAGLPALLVAKLLKKRLILKVVGDAAWEQKKPYLKIIQKWVARGADQIITPSKFVKNMVVSWGTSEDKIKIIYNAVEGSSRLDITKSEAKKRINIFGDIILSIGRLTSWKGFDDLIAVMPDLLLKNPNFRLVIVGEGNYKLKATEGVKLIGSVPHSEIPLYFKAADTFVLNSGYEGLSHVILEAMQMGVPVIASSEGGNPELIKDGFNGLLVEYKNQKQIKEAILKLWRDKELQEKFARNSKEKFKNLTWDNLVKQTLEILKSA